MNNDNILWNTTKQLLYVIVYMLLKTPLQQSHHKPETTTTKSGKGQANFVTQQYTADEGLSTLPTKLI